MNNPILRGRGLHSLGRAAIACTSLLLAALPAEAQDERLEQIIVTGTPGGSEMLKLDASFAITTIDDQQIEQFSPQSTADLLKLVPGVWAESSGGVAGANVFVRGFPGTGDAPFLTVQLNGSPIYPPPTLSFLENTTLLRIDETIERVEALRGGPNPVFSNGQPGLTTNFILKEGGEETEGLVKYTTSDYDLRRFDALLSGPLGDDLYYMIGGYISSSPGIRDTGFNAEEGQQFTINLTKELDNGTINVYHRNTDDHGPWYLGVALNVPGVDAEYNQIGTLNRQRQIMFDNDNGDPAFPDPKFKTLDLGEGRGWDGSVTGGSVRFDFGDDWSLTNRFNVTAGDADTLGLVPDGGAVNVGALEADPALDDRAAVTGPLTGSVTGRAIGDEEFIQQFGAWEVRKDIESFTNNISLARTLDQGVVTVGLYTANSSSDEVWSIGNSKYQVVEHGGEVVDGIACNEPTFDSCGFSFDLDATGDATTNAAYAALEFDATDELTLDFGLRFESHEVEYSADTNVDGFVDVVIQTDESEVAWTAAANYSLNDEMGVFGRINSGVKMPYFDDYRDNLGSFQNGNNLIIDVNQYEAGYKYAGDNISLYTTLYYTEVDPSFFVALSGQTPGVASTNEALGVEIDGNYYTDFGLTVNVNATIQESEIKGTDNDGNEVQRQPGWQLRVSPSYNFLVGEADVSVYGALTAVDDRFSDPGNDVVLEGYEKLDLGAIVTLERLTFQLAMDNLTDEEGLTEGDPRNPLAPNGRFIMPRTVTFSVGYAF
jgi:outer membrane receptor protein involved in Fe transport